MVVQDGAQLLELMRGYQVPCILAAAVELDLLEELSAGPRTAAEVATAAGCDPRGTTIVLDALAAVGLLVKQDQRYSLSESLAPYLCEASDQSVVAMLRHQANCLRRWSRLSWTVRSGVPDPSGPSVRGEEADKASFIEAMHVISRAIVDPLIQEIHPGGVRCVLDLGGASGSWTLAWLRAEPTARAIIFDLPHVIPMARQRLAEKGGQVSFPASKVPFASYAFTTARPGRVTEIDNQGSSGMPRVVLEQQFDAVGSRAGLEAEINGTLCRSAELTRFCSDKVIHFGALRLGETRRVHA